VSLRAGGLALIVATLAFAAPRAVLGESGTLELTPEKTQIHFELDATLHTVTGSMRLLRGALHFDAASGRAEGEIALDARSADTGNSRRDRTLHEEVLESERYPEIVFVAEGLELTRSAPDRGEVALTGRLRIHGDEHPLRIPAHLERDDDGAIRIDALFRVPYVVWGMKDVSNWMLKVGKDVAVRVDATAAYAPASSEGASGAAPAAARTSRIGGRLPKRASNARASARVTSAPAAASTRWIVLPPKPAPHSREP
jgi:polyisoprenoid-binding protein YceI